MAAPKYDDAIVLHQAYLLITGLEGITADGSEIKALKQAKKGWAVTSGGIDTSAPGNSGGYIEIVVPAKTADKFSALGAGESVCEQHIYETLAIDKGQATSFPTSAPALHL